MKFGFAAQSVFISLALGFFGASSSTNFTLRQYDLGNGGGGVGTSTNFGLDANIGAQSGDPSSSTNFGLTPGEAGTRTTATPVAATFTNPSNEYDRLQVTINPGTAPSDTRYLVAISNDNFATTQYVQNDMTVGATAALTEFQTYAGWGGASGSWIVGLTPGLTYKVKLKAIQGDYTASAFGPEATASTVQPSVTFSVETTLNSTPPFAMAFSSLVPGSIYSADQDSIVSVTTNAKFGGTVYIRSANAGLVSASAANTIASVSTDLAIAPSGYGAAITSTTQTSGGPITGVAPYTATGTNVGALSASLAPVVAFTAPVTDGEGVIRLRAKADSITPSASDYSDTLEFVAGMLF